MRHCPKCQATTVHHWPARTLWQRLRRRLSARKGLFRCAACGYMFFAKEHRRKRSGVSRDVEPPTPADVQMPDLAALDAVLDARRAKRNG